MASLRTQNLARLLARPDIRRANDLAQVLHRSVPTGFAELDAELPGGGWPSGSLTELLPTHEGIGELRLLEPALAALSQHGRRLAWIAPPYLPYAPALAAAGIALPTLIVVHAETPSDALWAAEQCLRAAACGAVLLWPQRIEHTALRRLQLAASGTDALALLFRPARAAAQPSPAALRLALTPSVDGLAISILKRRGATLDQPLLVHIAPPHPRERNRQAMLLADSLVNPIRV